MEKILLTKTEAAEMCSISLPTLDRLVRDGDFAPKIQLSKRRVAYYKADIIKWIESKRK